MPYSWGLQECDEATQQRTPQFFAFAGTGHIAFSGTYSEKYFYSLTIPALF